MFISSVFVLAERILKNGEGAVVESLKEIFEFLEFFGFIKIIGERYIATEAGRKLRDI
ncbi:hypothetical protein Ferp_1017 [Ferroglobus placidus DSM 10642]|uniref:Uncharacterized protein n=1 Tax=Ferroglobus placidus (strain DSM 10642 / AEDII12DO) TaxID=589924 RepID=D3RXG6_FERPA|nr:hypothetical protein [Ferroglobus placidus]ADC65179.1 hypothetical protein Ferp_1017 [Ferroglobus placidus DSM 10642]